MTVHVHVCVPQINSVLEEAIPSIAEAVTSIISHSNTESFKQSCHNIMEVYHGGVTVAVRLYYLN